VQLCQLAEENPQQFLQPSSHSARDFVRNGIYWAAVIEQCYFLCQFRNLNGAAFGAYILQVSPESADF
jgi:hypothetical protein